MKLLTTSLVVDCPIHGVTGCVYEIKGSLRCLSCAITRSVATHEAWKSKTRLRIRAWNRASWKRRQKTIAALPAGSSGFIRADWAACLLHYGARCVYCLAPTQRPTRDHVIPIALGGAHLPSNIVPACQPCNSTKGTTFRLPHQSVEMQFTGQRAALSAAFAEILARLS